MKRKNLAIILSAVMIITLFSACGTPSAPPQTQSSQHPEASQTSEPQQAEASEQVAETPSPEDSILARQTAREQEIFDDYAQGTYTFADPYVIQDPYELNPLTALVLFEAEAGTITVTVSGDDAYNDVQYEYAVSKGRAEVPVLGLYPGRENIVELKHANGSTSSLRIKTEPLPEIFPKIEVTTSNPQEMASGLTFLSEFVSGLIAVDSSGGVRWWLSGNGVFGNSSPILHLKNGRLATLGGHKEGQYYMESVYEIDFMGRVYKEYKIPGNSGHHEIRELPNGNLIVAAGAPDNSTHEDYCVEFDRASGEVVKLLHYKDSIPMPDYIADPVYVQTLIEGQGKTSQEAEDYSRIDWFHNNAFDYNEEDNSLILSARSLDGVFKINYETGELIWVLTDPIAAWVQAPGIKEKLLSPIGSGFEHQYGQHNVQFLPDGDIILFDNGCFRSKAWDTIVDDRENYSRAVRYRVNEAEMTVEQVWQYGKERGNELLSAYVSGVDILGDEHYLINFGGISTDPQGFNSSDNLAQGGHSTVVVELKDNKPVFELKLSGGILPNTYRAYRMALR